MSRAVAFLLFLATLIPVTAMADSADLKVTIETPLPVARASSFYTYFVTVTNLGPDAARNVSVAASLSIPGDCHWQLPAPLLPLEQRSVYCTANTPAEDGILTITASATSATPDANPSNNTATVTVAVTTNPDLRLDIGTASNVEPGFPFTLTASYLNVGGGPAVNTTLRILLPPGVAIRKIPTECRADAPTYVTCDLGTVPVFVAYHATPSLTLELLAPDTHGGGQLFFSADISGSRSELDPSNNSSTFTASLFRAFVVDSTADDGPGSLRQAITDANAQCSSGPCEVQFRFSNLSKYASIRPQTPLPMVTANNLLIDGTTQTRWGGDSNSAGPEIEINGSEQREGDGLVIDSACNSQVLSLVLNGFPGSAILLRPTRPCDPITVGNFNPRVVGGCYIGTDATGTAAVPNLRGITVAANGGAGYSIQKNVISGNSRSALFITSPNTPVSRNIIGLDATGTQPLGNGASGIFISRNARNTDVDANAIAFNHEFGIAIERGTWLTEIHGNSIHANWQPGIDIGLDGATAATDDPAAPNLLAARYDPQTNTTIVEGVSEHASGTFGPIIRVFANDAPDRSGFGQGQYYLGEAKAGSYLNGKLEFRLEWPGDLRGKFIAATATRVNYYGWLRVGPPSPDESSQGFERQTSEFSRCLEVPR